MKWHCGVCLYIYKWLGFASPTKGDRGRFCVSTNKDARTFTSKSKREGSYGAIFARPHACKQTSVLVENANPIQNAQRFEWGDSKYREINKKDRYETCLFCL